MWVRGTILALAIAGFGTRAAAQPQSLDGIAAIVNDEIVSIGEVRRAALLMGPDGSDLLRPACSPEVPEPAADTRQQRLAQALECLIDQRLVFREVRRFPQFDAAGKQVEALWEQVVAAYPDPQTRQAELRRLGTGESQLRADLRRQALVSAYIASRFRATAEISETEAREYFDKTLVPDMQRQGIPIPAFDSVEDEYVIPILQQREVNRRVESWIVDLRARATIERRFP